MDLGYTKNTFSKNIVYTIKSGRWKQNGYLVTDAQSKEAYVIDPGGNSEIFISIIENEKLKLRKIFLTHAHHDHVGGLKKICEKFDIEFYMEKSDYKIFRRAPMFALIFEERELQIPLDRQIFYNTDFFNKHNNVYGIKTPGHTKGGVVIIIENLVFTGDTILNKMVGRTDLPGACPEELSDSITSMFEKLADSTILFPGHGSFWTSKEAKNWWIKYKNNAPEYREEN